MICSLAYSYLTGKQKATEADASVFVPLVSSKVFPFSVRKFFRFGVPEFCETSETEEKISLKQIDLKL